MTPDRYPVPPTSFVGREHDIRIVREALARVRLVTLSGPPGVGKTRLAAVVAERHDDVAWVSLDDLDAPLVAPTVSSTAGAPGDVPPADALRERALLLVLDTCDHVLDACAEMVAAVLRNCPAVRVLATSREPLGLSGELVHAVRPLETAESVRLFLERSALVRNGPPPDLAGVADVCLRLDGLPLAIELAAAQSAVLAPRDITAALELTGPRDAPPRLRSVRAAIEWSVRLLRDDELLLLARLSVFRGEFTIAAAEEVCGGDGLDRARVREQLAALVTRSLVTAAGDGTFRLLHSIRRFALERLALAETAERVADGHLRWVVQHAEQSSVDDARAALRRAIESRSGQTALILASKVAPLFELRGLVEEGRAWIDEALATDDEPSVARARALAAAASLARVHGDFDATRALAAEALDLVRELGLRGGSTAPLLRLGSVAGSGESARSLSGDSLAIARQIDERRHLASSLSTIGSVSLAHEDVSSARALHGEALEIARETGDRLGEAEALLWLGNVAYASGDLGGARASYEESVAIHHALHVGRGEADALHGVALVMHALGDERGARSLHERALVLRRRIGHDRGVAVSCLSLAQVAGNELALVSESLDIARRIGDARLAAQALLHLGTLHERAGAIDAAADVLAESLEIRRANRDETAVCLRALARVARAQGREAYAQSLDDELGGTPTQAAPAPGPRRQTFRSSGEFWLVVFEGRESRLRDSKGMRHIAALLARPGQEIHALDLAGARGDADRGDAGELLDPQARAAYRRRLDDLREELEEAQGWGDGERAARAREEIEAITDQLAAAVGLGGRARRASSASERARWSVLRAVRGAMRRLADSDPSLGAHLDATVRTGTFCAYVPDPAARQSWDVG